MKPKEGGNGIVTFSNGIATKRLKFKTSPEKVKRFKKEMEILELISSQEIDNIVKVFDLNIDNDNLSYSMKTYNGDLYMLYEETAGNPQKTIELLTPIVRALMNLSNLEEPIYHRDLKPENILVEKDGKKCNLILADFGCAFLKDEKSERLTPDHRAVGAQFYRSPEYNFDRVEQVDEKGDIFSLGKILWSMVNGVRNVVFPYTLWFPAEYNLANRFPNNAEVVFLNLIIAACTDHNPQKRPTYSYILNQFEYFLRNTKMSLENQVFQLNARTHEAKNRINQEILFSKTEHILLIFISNLKDSCQLLIDRFSSVEILCKLLSKCNLTYSLQATVEQIAIYRRDCPVFNFSSDGFHLQSRIDPPGSSWSPPKSANSSRPSIKLHINFKGANSKEYSYQYVIFFEDEVLMEEIDRAVCVYKKDNIYDFLARAFEAFFENNM